MGHRKFIAKNYKHKYCGGAKAKSDIETILEEIGYENVGINRSFYRNNLIHGIRNYFGCIKGLLSISKNDIILLQYPMKLFFDKICNIAHNKGARIICLIHDLSSFRNKSVSPEEEINRLNNTDVLLTHNHRMREWLLQHGCSVKMIDYEIMDYLYGNSKENHEYHDNYSLFYVGNVSFDTHPYLRKLASLIPNRDIFLYGFSPSIEGIERLPNVHYMGVVPDMEIIQSHKGDFGLSWYGESLDDAIGKIGEYMEFNNPHKVSLYLRCNTPVIVWSKAGRSEFIEREGIGLCVSSLKTLDNRLRQVTEADYERMVHNVRKINMRLSSGYYLKKAIKEAETYLNNLQ